MGDGGLGQAEWFGQIADAGFAAVVCGDQGNQPQAGGIGQGLEEPGQLGGLAGGNRLAQQRGAAGSSYRRVRLKV